MAGQLPRPWFRLGSMTRPATATPATDQPRPVPARVIRPPIIRPALVTDPPEPTTPQKPVSNTPPILNQEPSTPPAPLSRPLASTSIRPIVPSPSASTGPVLPLPSATTTIRPVVPFPTTKPVVASPPVATTTKSVVASPSIATTKKSVVASPPLATTTKHVVSSPPATSMKSVVVSPQATVSTRPVIASPPATMSKRPVVESPSIVQSGGTAAVKPDETGSPRNSEKGSSKLQVSPVPSPSLTKSIPAVSSPYVSPKTKVAASPPSPLVLPPPQLKTVAVPKRESIPQEVERKTVVFQKVMDYNNDHGKIINGKQDEAKKLSHDENHKEMKSGKGSINGAKKGLVLSDVLDKDYSSTRFITMAGENRGASMEIVLDKNNNNNNINHNNNNNDLRMRQTNNDSENEEGENKNKKKWMESGNVNAWPMKGFFNSNVQGINNSILMDSKFAHHDPGIHLRFSKMPPAHNER